MFLLALCTVSVIQIVILKTRVTSLPLVCTYTFSVNYWQQVAKKVTKEQRKERRCVAKKKRQKMKINVCDHSFWSVHSTERCICVSLQILDTASVKSSKFPKFFNRLGTFYWHMIKFFCILFLIHELHHWLKCWNKLVNITNQKLLKVS